MRDELPLLSDHLAIVLNERPLIDVRAPVEFEKGSFPGAVNLPLMNNEERHRVGTVYKKEGHDAAVALGYRLVSGAVKEARITAWAEFVRLHPDAVVFCFRGGLRSRLSQEWLSAALGRPVPRLEGGYKAFRAYLTREMERARPDLNPVVLGGRTGSGKTLLLHTLPNIIDLEKLANHRGSSFGRFISPQPPQISFEHALGYALLHHVAKGHRHLVLEDEGHHVGRRYIPPPIRHNLYNGPLVMLETPLEERVTITHAEYVVEAQRAYSEHYGREEGLRQWAADMHGSLERIKKRLGGVRFAEIGTLIDNAVAVQQATGDTRDHRGWIARLLVEYYDPMYDYQLARRAHKIVLRGDKTTITHYLQSL